MRRTTRECRADVAGFVSVVRLVDRWPLRASKRNAFRKGWRAAGRPRWCVMIWWDESCHVSSGRCSRAPRWSRASPRPSSYSSAAAGAPAPASFRKENVATWYSRSRNRPGDLRPRPHQRAEAVSNRPFYWIFATSWQIVSREWWIRKEVLYASFFLREIYLGFLRLYLFGFFYVLFHSSPRIWDSNLNEQRTFATRDVNKTVARGRESPLVDVGSPAKADS